MFERFRRLFVSKPSPAQTLPRLGPTGQGETPANVEVSPRVRRAYQMTAIAARAGDPGATLRRSPWSSP